MDVHINGQAISHSAPKKRVLFIVTQSEFGGAQQFLFQFLKHASKGSYEFHVATGSDGDGSFRRGLQSIDIPSSVLFSLRRDIHPLSDIKAVQETKKLIDTFYPDTLFLVSSKAGFIGSLAARLSRVSPKVIYRIGGWSFNDPGPSWKKKLWERLEKLSASWKDVIILNNARDMEDAKRIGIRPRGQMLLVHNGIDPYRADTDRHEARAALSQRAGKESEAILGARTIVGTIANFYPSKGLEYLIAAAEHIEDPGVIFCVIGDGPERPMLEKLIVEKELQKKVILLGQLEQASQYLPAFDLFVLSSVKEGFPWGLLEAMTAKLPVIATRVGAVPEILEDGVTGYIIEPRDPLRMAEKIRVLIDNDLKAQEMGIKAHQRVIFAFNVGPMVARVEELL